MDDATIVEDSCEISPNEAKPVTTTTNPPTKPPNG